MFVTSIGIDDEDWVKIYSTSEHGSVGLVREGEGAWHKVQDRNAVMLSIVTREVDAWYERLKNRPGIRMLKPIGDGGQALSSVVDGKRACDHGRQHLLDVWRQGAA